MAETNIKVLKIEVDTGTGALKVNGVTKSIKEATAAAKEFATSSKKMSKATENLGSSAGIAGATVNEFGRLISDAPFGITAVTNNISQLGSMFTILVQKTGSVNKAFKSLFQTLKASPALVALLAFQALVAAIEFMAQSSRKASKANDDLARSIGGAATNLRIAKEALDDENVSSEEKREIINAINSEYTDLNLKLDENNQLTEESAIAIDKEVEAITRRAKARAIEKLIQEEQEKIAIAQSKAGSESLSFTEKALSTIGTALKGQVFSFKTNMEVAGNAIKNETIDASEESIKKLEELLKGEGLVDLLFTGKKDTKLKTKLKKVKKLVIDFIGTTVDQARERAATADNIFSRLFGQEREDMIKQSLDKSKNELDTFFDDYVKKQEISANLLQIIEDKRQERLQNNIDVAQAMGAIVSGVADNIDAAYQKEIDIEQNRTTALNNELRQRLANEQLSANERKNIQDQIAKNDEALRVKQEEIEKKRFKANKVAAIAEATISTFVAATGVLKDTKGGSVARIAGMIAVIGAGLAQVAMIAKQQFVSSQSSIGAGSGAGVAGAGVQAPDFNIVGQSASNQIAAAVQGQFQQPIKAYVVSKDVSTAQEMDRNIVGSATLG